MIQSGSSKPFARPSLSFVLLCCLLAVLWLAGGASRGDQEGQVVVRIATWLLVIVALLFSTRRREIRIQPVAILIGFALALALLQLIPLPPALWQALPGRDLVTAAVAGGGQPWRSLSLVPGATINAAMSLVVPAATLLFLAGCREKEVRVWLPSALLTLVVAAILYGLLQLSGMPIDNPLINDSVGDVSAIFANRNHFALFLAIGCVVVPVWAVGGGRRASWRAPVALAIVLLIVMMILAIGSRAGLLLGTIALVAGLAFIWQGMGSYLRLLPRWVFSIIALASIALVAIFAIISVMADRAESVTRIFSVEVGRDMRSRSLPTVLDMRDTYFPWGSGLSSFERIFKIHEPDSLLKPTFFNHAHNDFLEIILDTGLFGIFLFCAVFVVWGWFSFLAWRYDVENSNMLPRLGSVITLLVMIASVFDYPVRTPIMMAVVVIASVWLSMASAVTLPRSHL
jgi:O-antigen ligase